MDAVMAVAEWLRIETGRPAKITEGSAEPNSWP
jgi:hypothetical protein